MIKLDNTKEINPFDLETFYVLIGVYGIGIILASVSFINWWEWMWYNFYQTTTVKTIQHQQ